MNIGDIVYYYECWSDSLVKAKIENIYQIGLLVLIMDVIVILVIENVIAQNVGNYVTLKMLIKHLAMLIKFYTYK